LAKVIKETHDYAEINTQRGRLGWLLAGDKIRSEITRLTEELRSTKGNCLQSLRFFEMYQATTAAEQVAQTADAVNRLLAMEEKRMHVAAEQKICKADDEADAHQMLVELAQQIEQQTQEAKDFQNQFQKLLDFSNLLAQMKYRFANLPYNVPSIDPDSKDKWRAITDTRNNLLRLKQQQENMMQSRARLNQGAGGAPQEERSTIMRLIQSNIESEELKLASLASDEQKITGLLLTAQNEAKDQLFAKFHALDVDIRRRLDEGLCESLGTGCRFELVVFQKPNVMECMTQQVDATIREFQHLQGRLEFEIMTLHFQRFQTSLNSSFNNVIQRISQLDLQPDQLEKIKQMLESVKQEMDHTASLILSDHHPPASATSSEPANANRQLLAGDA